MNTLLKSKIFPEVGWLAPDGSYFPCEAGSGYTRNWLHIELGEQIIRVRHPELVGESDIFELKAPYNDSFTGVYDVLLSKGYIRVDIKGVFGKEIPTRPQVDTLFNLYKHPASNHYPDMKEAIRIELIANGLTFLTKPGDK